MLGGSVCTDMEIAKGNFRVKQYAVSAISPAKPSVASAVNWPTLYHQHDDIHQPDNAPSLACHDDFGGVMVTATGI